MNVYEPSSELLGYYQASLRDVMLAKNFIRLRSPAFSEKPGFFMLLKKTAGFRKSETRGFVSNLSQIATVESLREERRSGRAVALTAVDLGPR